MKLTFIGSVGPFRTNKDVGLLRGGGESIIEKLNPS
jgi:hypothetical protein